MQETDPTDFRSLDPSRTPDWRWNFAVEHFVRDTRPAHWEDPWIHTAVGFLASERPTDRNGIELARSLYEAPGPKTWYLDALLLTENSMAEVVRKMQLPQSAVDAYEALFFNVRCHGRRAGMGWIMANVLGLPPDPANPPAPFVWKYMALAAGPLLVELLYGEHLGLPTSELAQRRTCALRALWATRWAFTPLWDKPAWRERLREAKHELKTCVRVRPRSYESQMLREHLRTIELSLREPPTARAARASAKASNSANPSPPRKRRPKHNPKSVKQETPSPKPENAEKELPRDDEKAA